MHTNISSAKWWPFCQGDFSKFILWLHEPEQYATSQMELSSLREETCCYMSNWPMRVIFIKRSTRSYSNCIFHEIMYSHDKKIFTIPSNTPTNSFSKYLPRNDRQTWDKFLTHGPRGCEGNRSQNLKQHCRLSSECNYGTGESYDNEFYPEFATNVRGQKYPREVCGFRHIGIVYQCYRYLTELFENKKLYQKWH